MAMADMTRVGLAGVLERILQGQAVHDRGEHADVVGGGAVHARRRRRQAAEDVAATDDDGRPGRPSVHDIATWRAMKAVISGSTP